MWNLTFWYVTLGVLFICCRIISYWNLLPRLLDCNSLHLFILNGMILISDHSVILYKFCCSLSLSVPVTTALPIFSIIYKFEITLFNLTSMPLTYVYNKYNRPKDRYLWDPTWNWSPVWGLAAHNNSLFSPIFLVILRALAFSISLSWGSLSNAFWKSKYSTSNAFVLSWFWNHLW